MTDQSKDLPRWAKAMMDLGLELGVNVPDMPDVGVSPSIENSLDSSSPPQWISVEDRLPEYAEWVIVWRKAKHKRIANFGYYCPGTKQWFVEYQAEDDEPATKYIPADEVSHWTELERRDPE